MTSKDVTVVIPVYNSSNTICQTLDSIYNQTDRPAKVLLINDGSKDNSQQICEDWIRNHSDLSVELINKINEGVSKARNTGINLVQTDLTALLDSDDCWKPEKLKLQADLYNSNPELVLTGTGSNLRPITNSILNITKKDLLKRNLFVTSSIICKTNVLKQFLFDVTLNRSEDYNLWIKIISTGNKACILNFPLVDYRIEGTKLSNDLKAFCKDEQKQFSLLYKQKYLTFFEMLFSRSLAYAKYIKRRIKHSPYGVDV